MNIIQQYEAEQMASLSATRAVPVFAPGDTVRVAVKVVEGDRSRTQAFEGVCIARSNKGLNSNFTVRKISYGEGVERVFPIYSPLVDSVEVIRRGKVRRAKLYYLRGRRGKAARIAERQRGTAEVESDTAAAGTACVPSPPQCARDWGSAGLKTGARLATTSGLFCIQMPCASASSTPTPPRE